MPIRTRFLIPIALVVAFLVGPSLVAFYTDWLWFGEVGYQQVYATTLRAQGALFIGGFAVAVAWLMLNLRFAVSVLGDARPVFTTREGLEMALPGQRQLQALVPFAALVGGLLAGLFFAGQWETWLTWRNAVSFGQSDPILGHDISFYVFSLPLLQLLRGAGQVLVVLAAVVCGALYFVSGSLSTGFPAQMRLSPAASSRKNTLARSARCRRLARQSRTPRHVIGPDLRCKLCRRLRPHPGLAAADRRLDSRCGACRVAGVSPAQLADRGRRRRISGGIDRRRDV
jgi:uncharacterized membrane protein (UPF0182 family)